ncbi:MAG TPA: ribulose-phosphate 3-epimerase [bacterium]|nr:ribulose-phosphate 3-epimerase [bacterium]HOY43775.1 ribulose-phosphate 3-epimerase [bacterium]HPG83072.1 ribulose-phosphate 3-epimerase [bacterium]HPM58897.1 ribulose-phosphate 3-epimerase [bacterium]
MAIIAPSVLNADFSRLAEQITALESGGADWIHLDIMDGHFVPNMTFGPMIVAAIRRITALPLDVHLMISNADAYISAFQEAGADLITVHVEACPHLWRTLENIRTLGVRPGVTLNPATPLLMIEPVLSLVEMVLVMSVEPGFGGQRYLPGAGERIAQLKRWRAERSLEYLIEVDGGIDETSASGVVSAGADVLVIGQAIFRQNDIAGAVRQLRMSLQA